MARNTRTYSDFDLNFMLNPVTKDIGMRYDENAVKASVKNLVLTRNYERPFHSDVGTQIGNLLFSPAGPMLDIMLKRAITDVINTYEPRAVLMGVEVISKLDSNDIDITITFRVVNRSNPVTLSLLLKRTR